MAYPFSEHRFTNTIYYRVHRTHLLVDMGFWYNFKPQAKSTQIYNTAKCKYHKRLPYPFVYQAKINYFELLFWCRNFGSPKAIFA